MVCWTHGWPPNNGGQGYSWGACPSPNSCAPGNYSTNGYDYIGDGACKRCPADTYSSSAGATNCTPCPSGTSSPAGSTSVSDCVTSTTCSLCDTGAANRTKVICDNQLPWKPCGADKPDDFVLTCAHIEDEAASCSTCAGCERKEKYQYACCPQDTHPDADCAQGLCAGGVVNRNAVICDNRQAGSPCGSEKHAELVITCGEIHDQITWGHRQNCSQTAADYMTAHPQCCGSLVKVPLPHMNINIDSHAYRY